VGAKDVESRLQSFGGERSDPLGRRTFVGHRVIRVALLLVSGVLEEEPLEQGMSGGVQDSLRNQDLPQAVVSVRHPRLSRAPELVLADQSPPQPEKPQ
jgi:hypothetical protein